MLLALHQWHSGDQALEVIKQLALLRMFIMEHGHGTWMCVKRGVKCARGI